MNTLYPWTACGPVEGAAGPGKCLPCFCSAAEFAGSETVVSSSDAAVATIGAYIPYS